MNNKPGYSSLRKGRVYIPNQIYHLTASTLNRANYFSNFELAKFLSKNLYRNKQKTLAFVVMPDHFHWLVQIDDNVAQLGDPIKSLKVSTIRFANNKNIELSWQKGFYDRAIRKEEDLEDVARYIVMNPVRAGIVKSVRTYPFWNAIWL
jgi:REP element-mobilizing transposase RayT